MCVLSDGDNNGRQDNERHADDVYEGGQLVERIGFTGTHPGQAGRLRQAGVPAVLFAGASDCAVAGEAHRDKFDKCLTTQGFIGGDERASFLAA